MSDCDCNTTPCGCDEPCFADDATGCTHEPVRAKDDPSIVTICKDYQAVRGDRQIDMTRGDALVTVTLPKNPQPGDEIAVAAIGRDLNVAGGCKAICGTGEANVFHQDACTLGIYRYTTACVWVPNAKAFSA